MSGSVVQSCEFRSPSHIHIRHLIRSLDRLYSIDLCSKQESNDSDLHSTKNLLRRFSVPVFSVKGLETREKTPLVRKTNLFRASSNPNDALRQSLDKLNSLVVVERSLKSKSRLNLDQVSQLAELNQSTVTSQFSQRNGVPEVQTVSSPSSLSLSSRSPSPIRSHVVSPFATGTIAPIEPYLDTIQDFHVVTEQPIPVPSLTGLSLTPFKFLAEESYPNYLNPFDSDEDDDNCVQQNSKHSSHAFENHVFNEFPPKLDPRQSRLRKKPPPLPPPPIFISTSNPFNPTPSLKGSPHHIVGCINSYRSSSTSVTDVCNFKESNTRTASHNPTSQRSMEPQHSETRSMIMKRPAPPLPVYEKRLIRADPETVPLSFGEFHALLYTTNEQINSLEREARILQEKIKQASHQKLSVNELLDKWVKVIELKGELSKKHTNLLRELRCQELEDRHSNLEHEFRLLWAKQSNLKTSEEKDRETQLLNELLDTVNQRAELIQQDGDVVECCTTGAVVMKRRQRPKLCLHMLKQMRKLARDKWHFKKY